MSFVSLSRDPFIGQSLIVAMASGASVSPPPPPPPGPTIAVVGDPTQTDVNWLVSNTPASGWWKVNLYASDGLEFLGDAWPENIAASSWGPNEPGLTAATSYFLSVIGTVSDEDETPTTDESPKVPFTTAEE